MIQQASGDCSDQRGCDREIVSEWRDTPRVWPASSTQTNLTSEVPRSVPKTMSHLLACLFTNSQYAFVSAIVHDWIFRTVIASPSLNTRTPTLVSSWVWLFSAERSCGQTRLRMVAEKLLGFVECEI